MVKSLLMRTGCIMAVLIAISACGWSTAYAVQSLYGHHTVYFVDTDFTNGGVTCHIWHRDAATGSDSPIFGSWEERKSMDYTNKKVTVDGKECPVYKLEFETYYDTTVPTHLLFQKEKANDEHPAVTSKDYVFTEGAVYNVSGDVDWSGDTSLFSSLDELEDANVGKEYKVYFCLDLPRTGHWDVYNLQAHIWGPDGDYRAWDFNDSADPMYNAAYAFHNGVWSRLATFTFWYFGAEPTGIIFHNARMTYDYKYYQTPDLEFKDGGLYYFVDNNTVTEAIADFEIKNALPDISRSVYIADVDNWYNPNDYYPWLYASLVANNNVANFFFAMDTSEYWDRNIRYVKIKDKFYQVKHYTIRSYGQEVPSTFTFAMSYDSTKKTGPMPVIEDALYYFSGTGVSTEPITDFEIYDEIPEDYQQERKDPVTVYLNLGANEIMQKGLWEPPHCHAYKREPGQLRADYDDYETGLRMNTYTGLPVAYMDNGNGPEDISQAYIQQMKDEEMTMVRPGVWKYTIEDPTDINDITFYYYSSSDEYEARKQLGFHPATYGRYNNPIELTTYVYDIGTDCVHQSYVTVDEYEEMLKQDIDKVYLVGTWEDVDNVDDPINSVTIESDHGCFFHDFEVTEDSPASFKVSTVDVPGIIKSKGVENTYSFQRGWATYNLGIIGCHINTEAEDYEQWYDEHVIRPETSVSREIRIKTNECLDYNGYTQYPWRVEVGDHGVVANGHYWMVLDLNEQTAVLLDFDPHPHVVAQATDIRSVGLTADAAEALHDGVYLAGSDDNGKVLFDKVNIAKGRIDIEGTGNDLIEKEGFEVVYTVYADDEAAFTREGKPESIYADYLDLSDEAKIAVRGRFHDTKTDKYFSTRYSEGDILADINRFGAPAVEVVHQKLGALKLTDNAADGYMVTAKLNLTYGQSAESDGIVAFPDYDGVTVKFNEEVSSEAASYILHQEHPLVNSYNNYWYLGMDSEEPWTPYDGEGEFQSIHNWSNYILSEGKLPLQFEKVAVTPTLPVKGKVEINLNMSSVYPFLVARHPHEIAAQSPRRIEGEGASDVETAPENIADYKMTKISARTPVLATFDEGYISGVENVSADLDVWSSGLGDAEYFDLSGKRVGNNPAPGIYIVRQGQQTRKVIVR